MAPSLPPSLPFPPLPSPPLLSSPLLSLPWIQDRDTVLSGIGAVPLVNIQNLNQFTEGNERLRDMSSALS